MDLLADLTPAQCEAVTHVEGPLLVLAGAGSGKTRVITRRVGHLLSHGIPGKKILALTFTNKAAGEMRARILALAPEAGVWVGTFHGLCARLLRSMAWDMPCSVRPGDPRLHHLRGSGRAGTVARKTKAAGHANRSISMILAVTPRSGSSRSSAGRRTTWSRPPCWPQRNRDHVRCRKLLPRSTRPIRTGSASRRPSISTTCSSTWSRHPQGAFKDVRMRPRRAASALHPGRRVPGHQPGRSTCTPSSGCSLSARPSPTSAPTGDPTTKSIYGWRGANLSNIPRIRAGLPGCRR